MDSFKIIIMFCIILSTSLMSSNNKAQILILNSYHKDFKWSDVLIDGVKETLEKEIDFDSTTLYMDSKRIATDEYYEQLLKLYKLQLKDRHYDIVLLVDKFAYEFALKNYDKLFTNEKLVFSGIEQFDKQKVKKYGLEDKVYGVLEKRAILGNMNTISTIMPKLKKLYIINDISSNAADTDTFIQKAIDIYKDKFNIEYIRHGTMKEFKEKFSKFYPNQAVFFVRFYNGRNNQFYQNYEIYNMINSSQIPVFVTDTLFLEEGAIGGQLLSIKQIGVDSGNLMLKILRDKEYKEKIKINRTFTFTFNYNKINKFNLDPSLLKKNFDLVNTPISFFDKHRDLVNIVFILSPVLVLLIILILYILKLKIKNYKDQEFIIQQSKLAEIGEIISSIAHQWKEPLIEISTLVQEHLGYKEKIDKDDEKYLNDVMLQIHYMSDTINDFQQFIKPTSKKTIFNIKDSIEKMLKVVEHNMKYNYIEVNLHVDKNTKLNVYGFPNELMQSILNIINNSRDAIIKKREETKSYLGEIDIGISNSGRYIQIVIKDNGGGIKDTDIKKIFTPYFTNKKKGYGIGLYMARVIIKDKMSGFIHAKNIDNGAKFTIKLKLYD